MTTRPHRTNSRRLIFASTIGLLLALFFSWLPMLWAHRAAYHVSEGDARWPEPPPADWPAQPDTANSISGVWGAQVEGAAHNLGELAETRRQDPTVIVHWMSRWEYGVPFRSMSRVAMSTQAGRTVTPVPLSTWQAGVRTPAWFQDGLAAREFVPIRPIWWGLFANWLIFAGLVWGGVAAFSHLRRTRRKRRGLCEGCGYVMAGLATCPECGLGRHVS
jgi:hypothetical protein